MLQEDINKLTIHINEKEKNKDYNLNIIVSEFDSILSSCTSKDDVLSLKSFCDTIKGSTRIGSFLYDDFIQKVNEREKRFLKTESSKEVGSKNKERAKYVIDKDGKKEAIGAYNGAGYINVDLKKNRELFMACAKMQSTLTILEARNTDSDISKFNERFSRTFNEVLLACKDDEDLKSFQNFLKQMSQLGDAGKLAYEQFYGKIPSKCKAQDTQKTIPKEEQEVDKRLEEYEEAYGGNIIDTSVLKRIYYKGQVSLSNAIAAKNTPIDKIARLKKYQKNTPEVIESLEQEL